MSIYRRGEIDSKWEPAPWPMGPSAADDQERGFHKRALQTIAWLPIPWTDFPDEGIFGHSKDWLEFVDAAFYATSDGEDLILIDNVWNGWPDPPRWGLASRSSGEHEQEWIRWGHFPDIPEAWTVPLPIT